MAGGPFAAFVPCDACLSASRRTLARRIHEGSENDRYACPRGHTFGIHWREIPSRPTWDEAELEARRQRIAERAHELFVERTSADEDGDAVSDWLDAEATIDGIPRR